MDKVKENRLRRVLHRRGYTLKKSRRRDEYALDYQGNWIFDRGNRLVAGGDDGMSMAEVEGWMRLDEKLRSGKTFRAQVQEFRPKEETRKRLLNRPAPTGVHPTLDDTRQMAEDTKRDASKYLHKKAAIKKARADADKTIAEVEHKKRRVR